MVTVADTEVGIVQLPKRKVETESAAENDFVVVTATYFFLVLQLVLQSLILTPDVHSQNTSGVAVTPVRPVAVCAVEVMPVVSSGYWMP